MMVHQNKKLPDLIMLRMGELTKTLAACAVVRLVEVIPMMNRLDPHDLRDERARALLLKIEQRLLELADLEQEARIIQTVKMVFDAGMAVDYARWLRTLGDSDICDQAYKAIRELQSLAITQKTLVKLARNESARLAWLTI
jgi:hypothetical protein